MCEVRQHFVMLLLKQLSWFTCFTDELEIDFLHKRCFVNPAFIPLRLPACPPARLPARLPGRLPACLPGRLAAWPPALCDYSPRKCCQLCLKTWRRLLLQGQNRNSSIWLWVTLSGYRICKSEKLLWSATVSLFTISLPKSYVVLDRGTM